MSNIEKVLNLAKSKCSDPEQLKVIEAARVELKNILTACERWRLGKATSGNAMLRIIRSVRDDV